MTFYGKLVKCTITRREEGVFVLKTEKDVEVEFSDNFLTNAAMIGLIDEDLSVKLAVNASNVVGFSFNLLLEL